MPNYIQLEYKVLDLFRQGYQFQYEGESFKVLKSDKPTPQGKGECKTDCYILLENMRTGVQKEIKISCKLPNNEFQENKITFSRAEEILGPKFQSILRKSSESIKDKFEEKIIKSYGPLGRIKDGHLTLGWKPEIASKHRTLSSELIISDQELKDYIYKGLNQTEEKKNSLVNGNIINGSGVAEYILISNIEDLVEAADVLKRMKLIDLYPFGKHYLIFTANNYRIQPNKTDGNRWLAVRIEWGANDNKDGLEYEIRYDDPLGLQNRSTPMKEMVDEAFEILSSNLGINYKDKFH